jgi:hypothetical protein
MRFVPGSNASIRFVEDIPLIVNRYSLIGSRSQALHV